MQRPEDVFDYLGWIVSQVDQHAVGLPRNEEHVRTWQGVLFSVQGRRMLVALDEVRAILAPPRTVVLPGARNWVIGLANVRGELTGVFDLGRFWFDTPTPASRHGVVFLAKQSAAASAFLVERSYGIRQVAHGGERPLGESEHNRDLASLPGFRQEVRINDEWLPILELRSLLCSDGFLNAVA
ncbi:MAG: chemotaxis protein CheW [Guyparkeria sp.]|uniref:chemotaxis protein CheW n=1 Tax=Guyparkeria sp. TaxID=2035736 RepID=UPI003978DF53